MIHVSTKPVIAYIDTEFGSSSNRFTEENIKGFLFHITKDCGIDILPYSWYLYLKDDINNLKNIKMDQRLILVVIKQEEYYDQQTQVIGYIRKELGKSLPIAVIPNGWGKDRYVAPKNDKHIYVYSDSSPELTVLIKRLADEYHPIKKWLWPANIDEQAQVMQQLIQSYNKNDDGCSTYEADNNHKVVAEALRIKTMWSPELVQEEFDKAQFMPKEDFLPIEKSVYDYEVEKFVI